MAVFFRALVMLVTLVGLPAAWIYYGPLPANAQRIVDRFVEVARETLGTVSSRPDETARINSKTAPRYVSPERAENAYSLPQQVGGQVRLASATVTPPQRPTQYADDEMQRHLTLLKELGVAEYTLEKWGSGYRFKCQIPLADDLNFTRHFEAIDTSPAATVRQVVGEVTSWQNARHDAPGVLWR